MFLEFRSLTRVACVTCGVFVALSCRQEPVVLRESMGEEAWGGDHVAD